MTVGEKVIARHWVVDPARGAVGVPAVQPGDEGFVVTDIRFSHECVTPMAAIFFEELVGADEKVYDPDSVLLFRDHLTFLGEAMTPERVKEGLLDVALELEKKQRAFAQKQGIKLYGELRLGHHGSEAICHSKILEGHAEPGMIVIGSDSHTPHAGAVGCVAFGVGTTAIFNSWITKDVRLTVPETVKMVVRGTKPDNVTAKDFMLEILRHPYVKSGRAIGKLVEYCGDAVESLSVDERDSTASPQSSTSLPIARPLFTYGWRRISSMKSFAVTLSGFVPRTTTLTVSGTVSRTSFVIHELKIAVVPTPKAMHPTAPAWGVWESLPMTIMPGSGLAPRAFSGPPAAAERH